MDQHEDEDEDVDVELCRCLKSAWLRSTDSVVPTTLLFLLSRVGKQREALEEVVKRLRLVGVDDLSPLEQDGLREEVTRVLGELPPELRADPPLGNDPKRLKVSQEEAKSSRFHRMNAKYGQPLENGVPLHQSMLWNGCSNELYQSLDPWVSNDVPCGISSNGFLVEHYVKMLKPFIEVNQGKKVYIVELGSGHGMLAFRLALRLSKTMENACVIMTDYHDYVMRKIQDQAKWVNPVLTELVQKGFLDFAVLDLKDTKRTISLLHGNKNVDLTSVPLAIVANYVFDSLPIRVFRRENHVLQEGTIVSWPRGNQHGIVNPETFEIIFKDTSEKLPIDLASGERVLYPETAMSALKELVNENCIVIVGDKLVDSRRDKKSWGERVPLFQSHGNAGIVSTGVDPFVLGEYLGQPQIATILRPYEAFGITKISTMKIDGVDAKIHHGFGVNDFDRLSGSLTENRRFCKLFIRSLSSRGLNHLLNDYTGNDFEFFDMIKWMIVECDDRLVTAAKASYQQHYFLTKIEATKKTLEMAQWFSVQQQWDQLKQILSQKPLQALDEHPRNYWPFKSRQYKRLVRTRQKLLHLVKEQTQSTC